MDKELKNRSGSISNRGGQNENKGNSKKTSQPGAKQKSNRQTKNEEARSSGRDAGEKKGPNNV